MRSSYWTALREGLTVALVHKLHQAKCSILTRITFVKEGPSWKYVLMEFTQHAWRPYVGNVSSFWTFWDTKYCTTWNVPSKILTILLLKWDYVDGDDQDDADDDVDDDGNDVMLWRFEGSNTNLVLILMTTIYVLRL